METTLGLIALTLLVPQGPNEAEKLFAAMEKKIVAAKTIRLKCDTKGFVAGGATSGKVAWEIAAGNKLRIEVERTAGGKKASRRLISDGEKLVELKPDGKDSEPFPAPQKFAQTAIAFLIESGSYEVVFAWPSVIDGKSDYTRHNLKLGPNEKIGEKDTRVLEYTLKRKGHKDDAKCKIWLDAKTNLPVKRRLEISLFLIEETYTEFSIDEKIDPKRFELPK